MAFQIRYSAAALGHLRNLKAAERATISKEVNARLAHQPDRPTTAIKRLRPNPVAAFELRLDDLRVLYNVDVAGNAVAIEVIGRKDGNKLLVDGEEFHEHDGGSSQ